MLDFVFRLGIANSFDQQARGAVLDLTGDDNEEIRRSQNSMKWYDTSSLYLFCESEIDLDHWHSKLSTNPQTMLKDWTYAAFEKPLIVNMQCCLGSWWLILKCHKIRLREIVCALTAINSGHARSFVWY